MLFKAIKKALHDGMSLPKVKEVLRKCGYDLTVTTHVNTNLLEIMFEVPEEFDEECMWTAEPGPIDGAEFFDMATRGVGIYRRATIRKLFNPNFVSAMALLGSPLGGKRCECEAPDFSTSLGHTRATCLHCEGGR